MNTNVHDNLLPQCSPMLLHPLNGMFSHHMQLGCDGKLHVCVHQVQLGLKISSNLRVVTGQHSSKEGILEFLELNQEIVEVHSLLPQRHEVRLEDVFYRIKDSVALRPLKSSLLTLV